MDYNGFNLIFIDPCLISPREVLLAESKEKQEQKQVLANQN